MQEATRASSKTAISTTTVNRNLQYGHLKRKCLYLRKYVRYRQNFNSKSWVFDHGKLEELGLIVTTTGNRKWLLKPEILMSLKLIEIPTAQSGYGGHGPYFHFRLSVVWGQSELAAGGRCCCCFLQASICTDFHQLNDF